jgi:heterodisulfide reductase subunit B
MIYLFRFIPLLYHCMSTHDCCGGFQKVFKEISFLRMFFLAARNKTLLKSFLALIEVTWRNERQCAYSLPNPVSVYSA